jgi:hypothetical protein
VRKILIIILTIGFFSCNQSTQRDVSQVQNLENSDQLEILYHQCDSIIKVEDTIEIFNSKLDTTIVETGIFSFLQYDYPLSTPNKLIELSKKAVQFERQGEKEKAEKFYTFVIDFYNIVRPQQLKRYTCMNGYLQYEVNSAILCSYAYEKLDDLDNSLKTLQPFLANVEAWNSKIHERYIQLCIDKFGMDKVRVELNNCGRTVHLKNQDEPEKEDWVVVVFGANIGVDMDCENEKISSAQADSIVRQMDFYKLIK